jgi:glutathione S-transferase
MAFIVPAAATAPWSTKHQALRGGGEGGRSLTTTSSLGSSSSTRSSMLSRASYPSERPDDEESLVVYSSIPSSSDDSSSPNYHPPPLALHYFGFTPGRGECIRLALFYAGIPFRDTRYSRVLFNKLKEDGGGKLPFGQFPILSIEEDEDANPPAAVIAQTASILRTVGRISRTKGTYKTIYPSNLIECANVDSILDLDGDLFSGLNVSLYTARFGFGFLDDDPSIVDGVRQSLNCVILPKHLRALESTIKTRTTTINNDDPADESWLAGSNHPTIADFNFATRLKYLESGVIDGISPNILEPFPKLMRFMKRFYALPEVLEYYALEEDGD